MGDGAETPASSVRSSIEEAALVALRVQARQP
jgi:hypothetical protein